MQGERTKKVAINVTYNFMNQFVTLVLTFLSRTIFIKVFGAQYLGLNGIFTDVLGILSLADMGISTAMIYNLYRPLAEQDDEKVVALVSFYKKVYRLIALFILVIGIAIVPFLRFLVNLEQDIPNLEWYYLFFLANVEFSYLCMHKTSVLIADQKNYVIAKITMCVNIAKILLQVSAALMWKNYSIYLLLGAFGVLVNNLIASYAADREYPYLNETVVLDIEEKTEIIKNIASIFLYKLSSVLLNATDNILISIMIGTVAVGYYSNYLMVQTQLVVFYSLIFTSATASIGNLIVKEKEAQRYKIFESEQSVCFLLCGIIVPCYVSLINDFIRLWIGEAYVFSIEVALAIGVNLYLSCVLQPLWSYREATGLYKKTKWVMMLCALANIFLSVILGRWIGIVGIILASALSRILTYVWYEPIVLFKEYFQKKPFNYYGKILINFTITTVLTGIALISSSYFVASTVMGWVARAVCTFIMCLAAMLIVYCRSAGMQYLIKHIKYIINNKEELH